MSDDFRVIEGSPRYTVWNDGRVMSESVKGVQWLSGCDMGDGYVGLTLTLDGVKRKVMLHTLMATLWYGERPEGSPGVVFINGDRNDRRVCNMRWGLPGEMQIRKERSRRVEFERSDEVEYRCVPRFERYQVGSDGSTWRMDEEQWMPFPQRISNTGYCCVNLIMDGRKRAAFVHRLVLEVFVGAPLAGQVARHHPHQDPLDNRAENLRWGTQSENMLDRNRELIESGMKHCFKCGRTLPVSSFARYTRSGTGLRSECRACKSAWARAYKARKKSERIGALL